MADREGSGAFRKLPGITLWLWMEAGVVQSPASLDLRSPYHRCNLQNRTGCRGCHVNPARRAARNELDSVARRHNGAFIPNEVFVIPTIH